MSSLNPMLLTVKKLERRITELEKYRYKNHVPIPQYDFWIDEEAIIGDMPSDQVEWSSISLGDRWRGRDVTAWMRAEVTIPSEWSGLKVLGLFDFGKTGEGHNSGFESLLYINKKPFQGVGSNHKEVFLPEELVGQKLQLLFKVWSGLNGNTGIRSDLEHEIRHSSLALLDIDTDDLYYTGLAVWHALQVVDSNGYEYGRLLQSLDRAFLRIDWRNPGSNEFFSSVSEANHSLQEDLKNIPKTNEVTVRCIGHTHIDVAWLWRLRHTREKSARSFSTVLRYMEQFPEYIFLQTQPQLYDYLEKDYPDIFEQIEKRVEEGRWEAGGAMWLESDCNIPSGESLVRQLVYGQRYYEQKFGARCEYLWLPDVFGYSWALPQILKKAGLRYFMTTKISWNVYNRFPHDTFQWSGIDGTEILTHYITTPDPFRSPDSSLKFYTYNGHVLPQTAVGIWRDYRDKEINNELLLSYGYGDGGGGPTREMLEMRRRLEHMPGMPKVITGRADEFFNQLEEKIDKTDRYVHRWDGELYLELHRGTYTSQAYNKKMNRYMENMLRNAEMVSTFYSTIAGFAHYQQASLYDSWKIVLRNQFHDILPGSSIAEVYEDCRIEYTEAEQLAVKPLMDSMLGLAQLVDTEGHAGYMLFNSLPWEREEVIEVNEEDSAYFVAAQIPAMGYTFIRSSEITKSRIDNQAAPIRLTENGASTPFYELAWNASGQLTRIYDKRNEREVLREGEVGNRFDVHEDKPVDHDAWDIDIFYYEKSQKIADLKSVEVIECGPLRAVIAFVWTYEQSEIRQKLTLYANDPRIDFVTEVSWFEPQQLLKVAFPVHIRSTSATYEIQYGNVQRPTHWNTSWDYARFETCAQRWIDISERDYGVSLLNDCKYGHDVVEHTMRLTLIKSAISPDANADIGEHAFTYSLLPHAGDWFTAGTQIQAQRLNTPVIPLKIAERPKSTAALPQELSFFRCDSEHVAVDVIKRAEDSDDWIVRCYEYGGKRGKAEFHSFYAIEHVEEVNLMEREAEPMESEDDRFTSFFKPYELKTFRIRMATL